MFNLKEELTKYKPILEVDQIENALQPAQLQDLVDILQHIAAEKTPSEPRT